MKPFTVIAWSFAVLVVTVCGLLLLNNKEQIANLLPKEDVNRKVNNDGDTMLHLAAWNGNLGRVKELIVKGAYVDAKNLYGNTPLMFAVRRGHLEVVQFLVLQGADVNAKNKYGVTPLHWATSENWVNISDFLVSKGANVNAKSENGDTPLDYDTNASRNLAAKYRK